MQKNDRVDITDLFAIQNAHGADLSGASFIGADLSGADLRKAILIGTDFLDAELSKVNVRSEYFANGINDFTLVSFTNLSDTVNLTQSQLNSMNGDKDTRIPDGLERPEHWLKSDQKHNDNETLMEPSLVPTRTKKLQSQVNLLIRTAPAVEITANSLALQINAFIAEYRLTAGNDIPPDVSHLEALAETFAHFGRVVTSDRSDKDNIIALEAQVKILKETIEKLITNGKPNLKDVTRVALITGIASAVGVELVSGVAQILGSYGPTVVAEFAEFMGSFIPPTPPPAPTPVISV